jgi:hypothetical protein
MSDILLSILTPILLIAGFLAGKLHERFAWNSLIRRGILPKPGGV